MNRYVELKLDSHGRPKPVRVNKFGKPYFKNLSPFPLKLANGDMVYTDAKNGTITKNELGQLVVRTRLRPDFNSHYIADLMANQKKIISHGLTPNKFLFLKIGKSLKLIIGTIIF